MDKNLHELFIQLLRVGIGAAESATIPEDVDWEALKGLSAEQGLLAVVLDGMDSLNANFADGLNKMSKRARLEWIGEVLQQEQMNAIQQKAAGEMALLFHENGIRTYVLKGAVIAECYPRPEHRSSVDVDCFLLPERSDFNAWELGNSIVSSNGFEVATDFYKNSTFFFSSLTVENHKFLTPFRGNKKLKALEKVLQALLRQDKGEDKFEETYLFRPPVMVTALFLIEHAYSHFLHEGLTWRMVLDWVMFCRKHREEIDWKVFEGYVDEFGFRMFYETFSRLGQYLIGDVQELKSLSEQKLRMLDDIWAPLDMHETVTGVTGKLALAGNTWRARWKYRDYTDISWIKALWIQAKGFLFEKEPRLD